MPPETLALLAKMFGGNNQQMPDMAGMIKELNAPSLGEQQRLAYQGSQTPSYMGNENNPFNSGFFKSMEDRQAIETARLGTPGFSSLTPGQQSGALGTMPIQDRAAGAIAASPSPWQSMGKFELPPNLTGPMGTPAMDAANLAQNMQMAQPGGIWSLIQQGMQQKSQPKPTAAKTGMKLPTPSFNFSR